MGFHVTCIRSPSSVSVSFPFPFPFPFSVYVYVSGHPDDVQQQKRMSCRNKDEGEASSVRNLLPVMLIPKSRPVPVEFLRVLEGLVVRALETSGSA